MIPRWAFWTALTMLSWGIWAMLGKLVDDNVSPAYVQALSTIGLIPVIAAIYFVDEPAVRGRRRRGVLLAVGAGIASSAGNIFYYQLLSGGAKAATVVPLTALAPLVTVLLAAALLDERLNRIQVAGVALSLLAIYLFNVQQEQGLLSSGLLWALAPIALWGLTGLMQKMSTDEISGRASAFWFLLAFLPVSAWVIVREPLPSAISVREWFVAAALGFTLALGNLTILLAYAGGGKASIIAPLAGLYPLVSIPIAFVALDEMISWRESVGVAIALLAVLALSYESAPAVPKSPNRDTAAPL